MSSNIFKVHFVDGKRIPDPAELKTRIETYKFEIKSLKASKKDKERLELLEAALPKVEDRLQRVEKLFSKSAERIVTKTFEYKKTTWGIDSEARERATSIENTGPVVSMPKFQTLVLEATVTGNEWKEQHPNVVAELFNLVTSEDELTEKDELFFGE